MGNLAVVALHYWRHGAAGGILREPMILGHELSGTVVRAAADGSGPGVGVRVAVHPLTPRGDGVTRYPADRPNLAPASTYLGSAMHLPHTQGGFADRVALPTRMLAPLPEGMSLRLGALAEPAAVAWHGVGRAGDVRGKRVAVIGAGPIGLLAVAVARHHGAAEVIATDLHDRPRHEFEAVDALAAFEIAADPSTSSKVLLAFAGASPDAAESTRDEREEAA